MSYDAKIKVPADAKAVIVAPSIVGDRFIQLTPVYTGGDVLADGAVLDTDRTASPLELDQIYADRRPDRRARPERRQQEGRA